MPPPPSLWVILSKELLRKAQMHVWLRSHQILVVCQGSSHTNPAPQSALIIESARADHNPKTNETFTITRTTDSAVSRTTVALFDLIHSDPP